MSKHKVNKSRKRASAENERFVYDNEGSWLSAENHRKLSLKLGELLNRHSVSRDTRNAYMEAVEIDLLGVTRETASECARKESRLDGKDKAVEDAVFPFAQSALDEYIAELLAMVMPAEAPYSVVTEAGQQATANAFAKAFRHQGVLFDHRNNFHGACHDAVTLDLGGLWFTWETIRGTDYAEGLLGNTLETPNSTSGMKATQLVPYNMIFDETVELPDLAVEGEFFAYVTQPSEFSIKRRIGTSLFITHKQLEAIEDSQSPYQAATLSSRKGMQQTWQLFERRAIAGHRSGSGDFLGASDAVGALPPVFGQTINDTAKFDRIQEIKMLVRLQPRKYGLATGAYKEADAYELWEFTILGAGHIAAAKRADTLQDRMPVAVSSFNFRKSIERSRAVGRDAANIGLLASTLLNMHKRALRKSLTGGLIVHDATLGAFQEHSEIESGFLSVDMHNTGLPLRDRILQLNDTIDRKGTMRDVAEISQLLGDFFGGTSQPAMAGLDRATTYQAQAVMATGARALLNSATKLDAGLGIPFRMALSHLTVMGAQDLTYVDPTTATLITLPASELQQTQFQIVQAQPLIGIDRMRAADTLRDLVNILMQSGGQLPPVTLFMLKHWMQFSSMPLDMEEYEQAAAEQVRQQQEAAAAEQGGQPTAEGGQPSVAPPALPGAVR